MIDLEQAHQMVWARLAEHERQGAPPLVLLGDSTQVLPYGWVFFYQARRYVETGDWREMLGGNAPLLVTHSGELHVTGTAQPLEVYLREYERSGSPHPPPAGVPVEVRITGWRAGLLKVSMTMAIREAAGIGLGAAKAVTDAVMRGESASVPVDNWAAAVHLAERLQELGAEARPARAAEGSGADDAGPAPARPQSGSGGAVDR